MASRQRILVLALCAVAGICAITGAFAILRVRGSDSTYIYDAPPTSESR